MAAAACGAWLRQPAIEAWVRALAPGGVAVVCYWPMGAGVEAAGPWRHWGGLIRRAIGDAAARRGGLTV